LLGDEAESLTEARELYRGPAREAARLFPESVNVSAAVSLAGIGFDRTEVRVVADPNIDRNTHQVEAEGAFGSLRFEIRNVPTDENPRTGRLTAMSVVSCLLQPRVPLALG
jgi:aspartate dehydrogenase